MQKHGKDSLNEPDLCPLNLSFHSIFTKIASYLSFNCWVPSPQNYELNLPEHGKESLSELQVPDRTHHILQPTLFIT